MIKEAKAEMEIHAFSAKTKSRMRLVQFSVVQIFLLLLLKNSFWFCFFTKIIIFSFLF